MLLQGGTLKYILCRLGAGEHGAKLCLLWYACLPNMRSTQTTHVHNT